MGPWFNNLERLINIDDQYKDERMEWIFGFPQPKAPHENETNL